MSTVIEMISDAAIVQGSMRGWSLKIVFGEAVIVSGGKDSAKSRTSLIVEDLVRGFPSVTDYQCELSEMLAITGGRFGNIDNPDEVEPELRRAVDLAQQLKEQYPAIPRYRTALARASQRFGTLLRETDRPVEAERCHREAVDLHQALADEFPSIWAYRFYLDMAYHAHAEALRGLGSWSELRDVLQRHVAYHEAYLESRSDGPAPVAVQGYRQSLQRRTPPQETLAIQVEDDGEAVDGVTRRKRRGRHGESERRTTTCPTSPG